MLQRLVNFFRPRQPKLAMESLAHLQCAQDDPDVFDVGSREPAASCVRLKDGRLHVIRSGGFPDLFEGPEHIVVSWRLADVLQELCGESVELTPVEVINVATGQTLAVDRFDVFPHQEITPHTLPTVDASGRRAWHFRKSHLFVTKQVMLDLQTAGFTSLQFEPGFGGFCASTASAG